MSLAALAALRNLEARTKFFEMFDGLPEGQQTDFVASIAAAAGYLDNPPDVQGAIDQLRADVGQQIETAVSSVPTGYSKAEIDQLFGDLDVVPASLKLADEVIAFLTEPDLEGRLSSDPAALAYFKNVGLSQFPLAIWPTSEACAQAVAGSTTALAAVSKCALAADAVALVPRAYDIFAAADGGLLALAQSNLSSNQLMIRMFETFAGRQRLWENVAVSDMVLASEFCQKWMLQNVKTTTQFSVPQDWTTILQGRKIFVFGGGASGHFSIRSTRSNQTVSPKFVAIKNPELYSRYSNGQPGAPVTLDYVQMEA